MADLDKLLDQLEQLLEQVETFEPDVRESVFTLLDGIDAIHRMALQRLATTLGPAAVAELRGADPAVEWLLDAYGVGVDEAAAADAALDSIRPYVEGHGGDVTLVEAVDGVVTVRLSGACAGCSASAVTARAGVEEALREGMPGFRLLHVEEDAAPAHEPPGPTLLQIGRRPE